MSNKHHGIDEDPLSAGRGRSRGILSGNIPLVDVPIPCP